MLLLQTLPTGTAHILSDDGMDFLPLFVRSRLTYLANVFHWHISEDEGEEGDAILFTYHEFQGKLSNGHYTQAPGAYVSPIHFWIAGSGSCNRNFYISGSSCWICPDSRYLYFDAIDPALLPQKLEQNVWWCIYYEEGIKVVRLLVLPPEDVTEDFPADM